MKSGKEGVPKDGSRRTRLRFKGCQMGEREGAALTNGKWRSFFGWRLLGVWLLSGGQAGVADGQGTY